MYKEWADGKLLIKTNYWHGKLNGKYIQYLEGVEEIIGTYQNDELNGPYQQFNCGKLEIEYEIRDNKITSIKKYII
jgi:antitoxin component YwqK of YwqJK toxin-antitoxin module